MPDSTLLDELLERWRTLWDAGRDTSPEELCRDCPELIPVLRERIEQSTTRLSIPEASVATPTDVLSTMPSAETPASAAPGLRPAQAPDEIGRLGPYRVLRVLGVGGMGRVYLAEDPVLQRRVALKVMLPKLAADPVAKGRFLREARAAAAVEHEHVVTIHQVGEDGVPYIAMQFLQGEPLDARLARVGRLPPAEAVRVGREVAEGLSAAHARGLIHRDVKPANVWVDTRGRVKVLDFGLARPARGDSKLSRPGEVIGTPAYMAPEHATGQPLDARADLFSLGCLLYETLTGRPPFQGVNAMATLSAVLRDMPPDPASLAPGVPPALSALVGRLLAKSPDQRPGSAAEVVRVLAAIERQATQPVAGVPPANPWTDIDLTEPMAPVGDQQPPGGGNPSGATGHASPPQPGRPAGRGRGWKLAAGAVVAAAAVAVALAINHRRPANGVLVVESDDPDAGLVIRRGDTVVRDRTAAREIELPEGEYAVEVAGPKGRFTADAAAVTIRKGQTEVVRVRRERAAAPAKKEPPPGPDPDRVAAEWVIKGGGYVHVYYGKPERALEFVGSPERLPRGPFHVVLVMIADASEADLDLLRPLTRLGVIGFGHQQVTDAMVERLATFPGAPRYSHMILPAGRLTERGVAALERFQGLTTLILSGFRAPDASLEAVARLPALELLELPGGVTGDAGVTRIARSNSVRNLNLARTRVTDAGLRELAGMGRLRMLNLDGTKVTDAGIEALAGLDALDALNVARTGVTDAGLAAAARLPRLESLDLAGLPVTDAGIERLRPLVGLKTLILTGTRVTDAGLAHLAGSAELRQLFLDQTAVTDEGLTRLAGLKHLRQVRVNGSRVTAAGVKKLREAAPGVTVDAEPSQTP